MEDFIMTEQGKDNLNFYGKCTVGSLATIGAGVVLGKIIHFATTTRYERKQEREEEKARQAKIKEEYKIYKMEKKAAKKGINPYL